LEPARWLRGRPLASRDTANQPFQPAARSTLHSPERGDLFTRLCAGRRLSSPALVADGNHARVDAFVSLGVVGSAIVVALGARMGDLIIGLLITVVILKITWDSWRTVSRTAPGEVVDLHPH
jgi:Co/Zn/Cd efflux system component